MLCRSPYFLVTCYKQGLSIEAWPWPLYLTMTSLSDHDLSIWPCQSLLQTGNKGKEPNCCMIDRITHDLWCDFDSAHDNFCFLSPELRQSVIYHDQPILYVLNKKNSSEIEEFVHIISMIYNYILQKGYQSMIFNCILSINDR